MSDPVKTPAPRSLAERAYLAIRDQLVMLDIAPGEPLNEDALARSLEVGRTPVREALKRLESERLVAVFPRRGTFATDVNIADLGHIFEVRHTLEPMAAAMAAERASTAERALLAALLEKLGEDVGRTPPDALMRLDLDVHRAIYRSTGNPFLEDTLIRYDNLATRIWCVFLPRLKSMAGHIAEHRFLIQAVLDGDHDAARHVAASHVKDFETAIRAVI